MEINLIALFIQIDEGSKSVMSSVLFDCPIKPNLNQISNKNFTKNTILIAHLVYLRDIALAFSGCLLFNESTNRPTSTLAVLASLHKNLFCGGV